MAKNDLNDEKWPLYSLNNVEWHDENGRLLHSAQKIELIKPLNDRKWRCLAGFHGDFIYITSSDQPRERLCESCGAKWFLNTCCGSTRWEKLKRYE